LIGIEKQTFEKKADTQNIFLQIFFAWKNGSFL
jgi:hypothetical protein